MSETSQVRRASVREHEFIPAVIPAIKSGKSAKEIAESLGMDEKSFSVRLSNSRQNLLNATTIFEFVSGNDKDKTVQKLRGEEILNLKRTTMKNKNGDPVTLADKEFREYLKTLTVVEKGVMIPHIAGGGGGGKRLDYSSIGAAAAALLSDDSAESEESES